MSIKFTTIPQKVLSKAIISTDMTFTINNIIGWNREELTSADFGTQAFGSLISPDYNSIELFEWDPATIADNSITFIGRGLSFKGDNTVVTANKRDWPAGTMVNLGSDTPQIMYLLTPLSELDTDVALAANSDTKVATQKAIKAYYDALVFNTIADATISVKGKATMSVAPASASNPIAVGDNDPRIPTQGENDAMAGTYGTPGTSNKFVTETDTGLTNNMDLDTAQSAAGVKTFSSIPISSAGVPTTDNQLATKGYIDNL